MKLEGVDELLLKSNVSLLPLSTFLCNVVNEKKKQKKALGTKQTRQDNDATRADQNKTVQTETKKTYCHWNNAMTGESYDEKTGKCTLGTMRMPTFSRLAGECAVADTGAAEMALATWPMLAVASATGESKGAPRE